jgi:hypothetical protein
VNANDRECIRLGHEIARLVGKLRAGDDPASTMSDAERDGLITRWIEAIGELARVPARAIPPRRVKADALIALAARSEAAHPVFVQVALSISNDILTGGGRR